MKKKIITIILICALGGIGFLFYCCRQVETLGNMYGKPVEQPALSEIEMNNVASDIASKPGEIGFKFKTNQDLVVLSNFVKGRERGFGADLNLINSIPFNIVNHRWYEDVATGVTSRNRFINETPVAKDLAQGSEFIVINIVTIKGGASGSSTVYILKDENNSQYVIPEFFVPWKPNHQL